MKPLTLPHKRRLTIRIFVISGAMVALLLMGLTRTNYLSVPDWAKMILVTLVSVGIMLSIADLVEDFLPRRKPIGAIFTFVVVLYVLPLISVNLAEYLLNNANVHGSKLLLYLLGYSINIIYCLLHRNVVEDRIAEFKAALYISAGVYALVLAILTMLAPSQVQDVGTSQVAAVFVSFTMCRGLVEIFSIQKESKYQ